jgi:hypothetical protein
VIDSSSFIVDTSRDEEFARNLFGDLNRDILGHFAAYKKQGAP